MSDRIKFEYISPEIIDKYDYPGFIKKVYGNSASTKYPNRFYWFKDFTEYKVLIAIQDDRILGQSCAFKDTAYISGKPLELWWGIDTFVLSEARGKKVGYRLQQKLYTDLPNFSSAWYSNAIGGVKKSLMGKPIFEVSMYYYPKDNFLSILTSLFLSKYLKFDYNINHFTHNLYPLVNYIHKNTEILVYDNYFHSNTSDSIGFINRVLLNYDFHLERSLKTINWKYYKNPSVKANSIALKYKGEIIGLIFFTDVYFYPVRNTSKYVCKILDVFIDSKSPLDKKEIPSLIFKYFKKRKILINGVISMNKLNYLPEFRVYRNSLLSSFVIENHINNPYLSLGDQDMEQMK